MRLFSLISLDCRLKFGMPHCVPFNHVAQQFSKLHRDNGNSVKSTIWWYSSVLLRLQVQSYSEFRSRLTINPFTHSEMIDNILDTASINRLGLPRSKRITRHDVSMRSARKRIRLVCLGIITNHVARYRRSDYPMSTFIPVAICRRSLRDNQIQVESHMIRDLFAKDQSSLYTLSFQFKRL